MDFSALFDSIDALEEEYIRFWEDICNIESPTAYKAGVDAASYYLADIAKKKGFDIEMLRAVSDAVNVPVIASGGAGCKDDFVKLFNARDLKCEDLLAEIRDLVYLSLVFLADKADDAVLFHLGKTAVHRSRRKPDRALCQPFDRLNDAVAVVRFAQAEKNVKGGFGHRNVDLFYMLIHFVLLVFYCDVSHLDISYLYYIALRYICQEVF